MKSTRVKIVIVGLALVLIGAVALSQTAKRHWHRGGMFGHQLAFFTHYLNLTDAQQAQVKEILAKEKPTLQPLLQQLAQGHHQLRQFEESGNFDEAQVRTIASQQSQNLTELIVQKSRIEAELVQILTPEQKAKLTQFMDKREQRFKQRMEKQSAPGESL